MPDTTEKLRALGELVRRRREGILGITIEEAAARAGFGSVNTWLNIEHGRRVRGLSYSAADRVLGWAPGSCKAVIGGGYPTEELGAAASLERQMELVLQTARNPAVPWESPSVRDAVIAFASDTLRRIREEGSNPGSTSVG